MSRGASWNNSRNQQFFPCRRVVVAGEREPLSISPKDVASCHKLVNASVPIVGERHSLHWIWWEAGDDYTASTEALVEAAI